MDLVDSALDKFLLLMASRGPDNPKFGRLVIIRSLLAENPDLGQMVFFAGIFAGAAITVLILFLPFLAAILLIILAFLYFKDGKKKVA